MQADLRASGVAFARSAGGYDLPVIDMTHPRFAVGEDAASVRGYEQAFVAEQRQRGRIPLFLTKLMLRSASRKSLILKALVDHGPGFLDSITTYAMKLGAENLVPPFDQPVDRKIASSAHVPLLRLRTLQVARLVADGLAERLGERPDAPLHLINIAGGPAMDSLNALILLKRDHPDLLDRPLSIHVLDSDETGPVFGANALASLQTAGFPLEGLAAAFEHRAYDWNETASLARLVRELAEAGAIVAVSSEGGLFEYGTDEAIVSNLTALRVDDAVSLVAGSVTRADMARRRMIAESGFRLVPRGIEGFGPLATRGGFAIARAEPAGLSDQVMLVPA